MKSASTLFMFLALASIARCVHAAPQSPAVSLSQTEQAYCHAYAESEYQAAVTRGDGLPDASYEGAQEECEMQWRIVETQWAAR